ncbi:ESCO1/2 acetyl-transferase-domain-containing protein [Phlyctochytrium arcticum]|nr:ESCO1/2 acetyl-transferase-domain-containing protein [Phlyctochytrium arcticum]
MAGTQQNLEKTRVTYGSRRKDPNSAALVKNEIRIESPTQSRFHPFLQNSPSARASKTYDVGILSTAHDRPSSKFGNRRKLAERKTSKQRTKSGSYEQLVLDFGQKGLGPTTCEECGMSFSPETEDDVLHKRYHRAVMNGAEWKLPKGNNSWGMDDGACVIEVSHLSAKAEKEKALEVLDIVNRELGAVSIELTVGLKVYLYITQDHSVVACCAVEPIQEAWHLKETSDASNMELASDDSVPARCGISRVWVLKTQRRNGIAFRLLDLIRAKFIYGTLLAKQQLAFSQPTQAGRKLAERYFRQSNFLVYNEVNRRLDGSQTGVPPGILTSLEPAK